MDTRSRSSVRSRSPRSSSPKKMSSPRKTRSVSRKRAASPRKTRSVSRKRSGKKVMSPFNKFWHDNKAAVNAAAKQTGEKPISVAHRMAKAAGVTSMAVRKPTTSRTRVVRGRRAALKVLRGSPAPSQTVEQKLRALFSRSPSRYSAAGRRKASPKMRKMRVKKTRSASSKPRVMSEYQKMMKKHAAEIADRAKATGEKYMTAAKAVLVAHGYVKLSKKTRVPRVRKAKVSKSPRVRKAKKSKSPKMTKSVRPVRALPTVLGLRLTRR